MRKLGKILITAMVSVMCVMMLTISAFAAEMGHNSTLSDYITNSEKIDSKVKSNFQVMNSIDDSKDASWVYYKRTENGADKYYYIQLDNESKAVDAINVVNNKQQQAGNTNDTLTGMKDGLNISADTDTAITAMSGFVPVISTILGLLVILITVGMTIFSAFDLAFIAFPVFRNKCEDAKQTGHGIMAGRTNKQTGETKLRFVSDDAQYAVVAADTTQSGKNPFVIYFGKRLLSYIVLAILLFILLSGNITIFTDLALKLVQGILDLIQGI